MNGQVRTDAAQQLPPALRRRYRVYFKPLSKPEVVRLRDVRAKDVGKLVTVKARSETSLCDIERQQTVPVCYPKTQSFTKRLTQCAHFEALLRPWPELAPLPHFSSCRRVLSLASTTSSR